MYQKRTTTKQIALEDMHAIIKQIGKNISCTEETIKEIDGLIESRKIPSFVFEALISQRNACAVNIMNFKRVSRLI